MTDAEILERLLKLFRWSNYDRKGEKPGAQFTLREGVTIGDQDPELETAISERIERE